MKMSGLAAETDADCCNCCFIFSLIIAVLHHFLKIGMCEVGVYRISGVSGEIQRLKKAFEKSMAAMLSKLCVIIRRQIFS